MERMAGIERIGPIREWIGRRDQPVRDLSVGLPFDPASALLSQP